MSVPKSRRSEELTLRESKPSIPLPPIPRPSSLDTDRIPTPIPPIPATLTTPPGLPAASWSRSMDEIAGELVQPAVVMGPPLSRHLEHELPPMMVVPMATPPPHDIEKMISVIELSERTSSSAIDTQNQVVMFLGGAQRRDEIRIVLAALTLIATLLMVVLLAVKL